jgi:hypothetical protein
MSETIGWSAMALAALIGARNFYCAFPRRAIHRALGRDYRWDSGLPGVGTICLVAALACLWHVKSAWIVAGVLAVVDTGGLPWFVAVMAISGQLSVFRAEPEGNGPRAPWTWLTPTLLLLLLAALVLANVAFNAGWLESPRP